MIAKRIQWIDQVKGFAIICMIVSHAIPGYTNGLKNWITAFNMPLFFFVSGYLSSGKHRESGELKTFLLKRFRTIGVPYFVFSFIYILFLSLISMISGSDIGYIAGQAALSLKNVLLMQGIETMWFLPVYFFASLIHDFGIRWTDRKTVHPSICAVFIAILLLMNKNAELNSVMRLIGKIMAALVFMTAGGLFRSVSINMSSIAIWTGTVVFSFSALLNGFVSVNFEFGRYPLLFFLNGIILSLLICMIFRSYGRYFSEKASTLLCLYGRFSIVILVTNNLIIETLRLLDYKLAGDFFLNHGTAGYLLFAVLILALEYPLILLAHGKCGYLFGTGWRK